MKRRPTMNIHHERLDSKELIHLGLRAVDTLCFDWAHCPSSMPRYYWRGPETVVPIPDFLEPEAIAGCLGVLRLRYELPGLYLFPLRRARWIEVGYELDEGVSVWWGIFNSDTCRPSYGVEGELVPPPIRSLFGGPCTSPAGAVVEGLEKWTRLYSPERARAYQEQRKRTAHFIKAKEDDEFWRRVQRMIPGLLVRPRAVSPSSASTPGRYHRPAETEEEDRP